MLVGLDLHPRLGGELAHLRAVGPLHQVALGGGWHAEAARPFFVGSLAGPAETPQLLVFVRWYELAEDRGLPHAALKREALLIRKVGVEALAAWSQLGFPVPDLPSPGGTNSRTARRRDLPR